MLRNHLLVPTTVLLMASLTTMIYFLVKEALGRILCMDSANERRRRYNVTLSRIVWTDKQNDLSLRESFV